MWILLTAIVCGAVLIAYVLIEIRVNQRRCPICRFRVSADAAAAGQICPRCGTPVGP